MADDARACYDELAANYHLIFENWDASMARQAAVLGPILQRECGRPGPIRVLDCACGIGTQALGLARLGFLVSGCDISAAAIERARVEAGLRGLPLPLAVADMRDLSGIEEAAFDAVVCMDNSLSHLSGSEDLVRAATQMRTKLRPGGVLMAGIRDYDRLVVERPSTQGPAFYSDQGRRRIVFQVWDWLDGRRYVFHLYITRQTGTGWQTFHYAATYCALLREDLTGALGQAGFRRVRWLLPEKSGYYQPMVLASVA